MNYSKFLDDEGIRRVLSNNCGIPLKKEDNNYLSINDNIIGYLPNNLIIGCNGSNYINNTILPYIDNIIDFNENMIVRDNNNIYEKFKEKLNNYNTIVLDYDNLDNSMNYNIFNLIEKINKESDYKAINMLKETVTYLLPDDKSNADPFWINSARDLFSGMAIYYLQSEEKISISNIYKKIQDFIDESKSIEFINSLNKESAAYISLSNTLLAPPETRKSIISVFNQAINKYLTSDKLINILNNNDIEFDKLNERFAIFIKGDNDIARSMINLLIYQINSLNSINKCHIILPDFDTMYPIKNLPKIINNNNNKNINYTITISSYTNLKNIYGLEQSEIIKMCFENTIYLLSQDNNTLEEISYKCGNKDNNIPLITPFELLRLNRDEAIVLMSRVYPIRIELISFK